MTLNLPGAAAAPRCSQLSCDGTFNLPMSFTNGMVKLDLGRQVTLRKIDVELLPTVLSQNAVGSISLVISTTADPNDVRACSVISQTAFTFRFDCLNSTARYLNVALGLDNSVSSKVFKNCDLFCNAFRSYKFG